MVCDDEYTLHEFPSRARKGGWIWIDTSAERRIYLQPVFRYHAQIDGHYLNDWIPLRLFRKYGGVWKPEHRLHALWMTSLILLQIGLGIFRRRAPIPYSLHDFGMAALFSMASFMLLVLLMWKGWCCNHRRGFKAYRDYRGHTIRGLLVLVCSISITIVTILGFQAMTPCSKE